MIRLLAIGNDPTIALPPAEVMGDTHQRQLKYASIVERYHLITQAPPARHRQARGQASLQLAANFWVHPCGRRGMADYVLQAVRTGWRIAREEDINVVSTQDPFVTGLVGYLVARRFGLPLSLQFVANAVDNPYWLREKRSYVLLNRLAHWLIRRADTYRVNSTDERDKLIRLGVPPERVWNLASITDFSRFVQADGKAVRQGWLDSTSSRHIVLAVARLVPQKDIATLLRAFAILVREIPDVLLLLVGSGPLEAALRRQAAGLGLQERVAFAGTVPYEQLPAYYAACDVLALSSVYEGNARVLAEAAAAAKAVVCTAVSGASDTILDGETGYIVPIGDHVAMAERLSRVLRHPETAREMGEGARRHVLALYDAEKLLAGFRDLWQTTAALRSGRGLSPTHTTGER